ncbi:MAG: hypothetical protein OEZ48_07330 [Candidatus Bathyarchaeota archaeon]|nr:hypothetical protein [Candidatus Bathyarchaeota archaeon]MDH5687657.1 hypothetical protein [Candidatus Bathyarchaeota archaeon]
MEDEDKELPQLKALYDELWSDARTMIKDMNRSILMYLFAGFLTLVLSAIMIGTAISDWNKILLGNASTLTYFYAIVETPGSVLYVILGVTFLYWYKKLKKRYSRLIQMEKTIRG